jgi:hypothetical protein
MKNWVIQGFRYDFNPTPYNYIKSRWSHFHFCKKEDPGTKYFFCILTSYNVNVGGNLSGHSSTMAKSSVKLNVI